jgi:hypothetical protein
LGAIGDGPPLYRQRRGFDKAWDVAWDSSSALPVDINRRPGASYALLG